MGEGDVVKETEATFTRTVLDLARLYGWRSAHFRPLRTAAGEWRTAVQGDGKGFPDLVLVRGPGEVVLAELKVGANKLTHDQAAWVGALERAGVPVYCWRPEHWPDIEAVLRDGPAGGTR